MSSSYEENTRSLRPFETFDAKIFVGDADWPQDVCDLVLALAMVHNDYSDIDFAFTLRNQVAPEDSTAVTPEVGYHKGLGVHLGKLLASLIHELFNLLEANKKALDSPALKKLRGTLPSDLKTSWDQLVTTATSKAASKSAINRLLLMARNKVAFHYDGGDMGRSYRELFVEGKASTPPLVSRGVNMRSTRFFFADAVGEHSIFRTDQSAANELFSGRSDILPKINLCLYHLVTRFIQSRGSWKPYRPQPGHGLHRGS